MKKVKITGKLSLSKETIAKLNDTQMAVVNGGRALITNQQSCPAGCTFESYYVPTTVPCAYC